MFCFSTHDILGNKQARTDYEGLHLSKKAHKPEYYVGSFYPLFRLCVLRHGAFLWWRLKMNTRIALIGIIVESHESVEQLNALLSEYGDYIIGRMGIPYREKHVSIISVAIDAPNNIISSLSGKLGMLPGISTKTTYTKQ